MLIGKPSDQCDAGVTQILPRLPKLSLLTLRRNFDPITYAFAVGTGEFSLQVRRHDMFCGQRLIPT